MNKKWTQEHQDFLKHSLFSEFLTFTAAARAFCERFPDKQWTAGMIAGRAYRSGLCRVKNPQPVVEKKEPTRVAEERFTPETPQYDGLVRPTADPVVQNVEAKEGYQCKWPLATGGLCGGPADNRGYCTKHLLIVMRGAKRVQFEGV